MIYIACFLCLLVAVFAGALAGDAPFLLVVISVILLAATILLVRRAATRSLNTAKTPCALFFFLAVAHILAGYLLAGLTTEHTSIRSNAGAFFAAAMLINSIGLLAGATGYAWVLQKKTAGALPGFPVATDPEIAFNLFRVVLLCGTALMFFAYGKLGLMDYLTEPAKWPFMRYITSDLLGGSASDEWIVNRAMDLITVSLPFVLFRTTRRPRLANLLLVLTGSAALLLPLRRANLLAVVMVFLMLVGIEKADIYRLTRRVIVGGAILYVASQCIFLLAVFTDEVNPLAVLAVSSTALPEVRDLGWTLSLLNGETLNGVTFAQALVPLPSIASDWSSAHSLRAISTQLIGLDQTGQTGGLRLTIFGEGYINFGYLGAMTVGLIWGTAVGWCERLLHATGKDKSALANYGASLCFVWICFLVYLAGTQAAAPIKMQLLLVLGIAWASKERRTLSMPRVASLAEGT